MFYRVTGQPSELWRQIITGFLGFGFISLLFWSKTYKHNELAANIFEALEKISRGNFDAFVLKDKHGYFDEFVDKINKMAKELGGVEQMRQDFISNVSHEFQSPLTSIGGYATLLRKEGVTLQQIENVLLLLEPQWSVKSIMPETSLPKTTFYVNEDLLKQVWIN